MTLKPVPPRIEIITEGGPVTRMDRVVFVVVPLVVAGLAVLFGCTTVETTAPPQDLAVLPACAVHPEPPCSLFPTCAEGCGDRQSCGGTYCCLTECLAPSDDGGMVPRRCDSTACCTPCGPCWAPQADAGQRCVRR